MNEKKSAEREPAEIRRGGAAGPRLNVRKGIQGALLVGALLILFTAPAALDRRQFIFGTMVAVVVVDLVMLLRGDLDYTHFHSREWSFRINSILLAIALVLFALTFLDVL